MKEFIFFVSLLICLYGCSKENLSQSRQKFDAVTTPSPKVAPYITEQRYFSAGLQNTLRATVNNVKPAIVSIGVLDHGTRGVRFSNTGSGVIIDPRGYILTSNAPVDGIKVTLFDLDHRHQFDGQMVAHDPGTNLALVKITSPKPFPVAPLGSSTLVKPGDWLIAFGSSDGLSQKVVPGIVGSSGRTVKVGGRNLSDIIQTDIRTGPGCTGGPFVDLQGRVAGINIGGGRAIPVNQCAPLLNYIGAIPAAFQGPGTGIIEGLPATPRPASRGSAKADGLSWPPRSAWQADMLARRAGQQVAGKKVVFSTWLGAEVVPVDGRTAKRMNVPWKFLSGRQGLLVNRVFDGSPADRAGIGRGDIIYEFNRRRVGSGKKLERIIKRVKPGKVVPVKVVRKGMKQTLYVRVTGKPGGIALPAPAGNLRAIEFDWMGVELGNLTVENVSRFGIPASFQGVVVISAQAMTGTGLRNGDLIRKVNGQKVREVGEFIAIAAKSKKGVLLDVLRQGEPLYITVEQ